MKTVVIGLLGVSLDALKTRGDRWQQWRPTVDLCRQSDLIVDRLELLSQSRYQTLVDQVITDIRSVSPETEVKSHTVEFDDAWDFELVYSTLHDFARRYAWKTGQEQYLVHITTGTPTAICTRPSHGARFARTSWRASTSGHSDCPRCASVRRTWSRTWTTSSVAGRSCTATA